MRAPLPSPLLLALAFACFAGAGACDGCAPPPVGEGEGEGDAGEGEGEGDAGEGEGEGEPQNACVPAVDGPGFQISAKAELRWKRLRVLETDLMTALGLSRQEVCSEIGLDGFCFDLIHLVPLGGNDPVKAGMYRPIAAPGATTSLAFERVVISACGRRVDVDAAAAPGTKLVWRNTDLAAASVASSDPGLRDDIRELYRRVHARDPSATELELAASLADPVDATAVAAADAAKLICFAVATTSEMVFQ